MASAAEAALADVRVEAGDHAPVFALPDKSGQPLYSHGDLHAARPLVLAFCHAAGAPETAETIAALRDAAHSFAAFAAQPLVIAASGAEAIAAEIPVLADADAGVARAYGVADAPGALVVVDHNRRIALIARDGTAEARLAAALATLARLARDRKPGTLGAHPPVLVMPRVLSRADCDMLIEVWHRPVKLWHSDGFRSGGFDGATDFKVRVDSYGRTDQFVVRDEAINSFLDARLARRIVPEIAKAFRVSPAMREDYRIACYDSAEAGALPAHRDNPTPQTRHRLFTVSVHLNAGDYAGGGLSFREFGEQAYEVERGTAVVWSCTLLHEVAPVTSGRRFILGTHLYNEEPRH